MATVIISGTSYDVYADESTASTYLTARIGADDWFSASSTDRKKALVSATRMLDRQQWQGTKTVDSQPLEFPRDGLTDCDGTSLSDNTTPQGVVDGSIELAYQLILDSTVQDSAGTGSNVKQLKAGSAEVTFFKPTIGASSSANTRFPTTVQDLVKCFLNGSGRSSAVGGLASGTDATSTFCDPDPYGRNTPLA